MQAIKVAIDTNLIIAGRWNPKSASSKIIDLCLQGKIQPVFSEKTKRENMWILEKVKPSPEYLDKIKNFFTKAQYVVTTSRIDICSDKSDNLYFEAALDGGAKYIVSNDHHLLEHDGYMGVRVMRPGPFLKNVFYKADEESKNETGNSKDGDTGISFPAY